MASLPIKYDPQTVTTQQTSPMDLLRIAVEKGADINTIERLAALQEKMLLRDAEFDFNEAMNKAQSEMRPVAANLENPQTRSKYASYAALDNALRPVYSRNGFSISYDTADSPIPDHLRIMAYCSRGGYTRTYRVDMPNDGKGAKGGDVMTKTHATGAAMSYGMRYLLKMIFNVAVGEADNDGNGGAEPWVQEYIEAIKDASMMDELQRIFREGYQKATKNNNRRAMQALIVAKDARKKNVQ